MRILKYILLLILLFFIGLSVFVSTQKANYDILRSKVIKTPKATVYNYVKDFKNWDTFSSWIVDDKGIQLNYSNRTIGTNSFITWDGNEGDGKVTTLSFKENDSIAQKMISNGEEAAITWRFKDTIGGTKVTLISLGKLDFKSKILAFFNGGIKSTVEDVYAKTLQNLDKTLDFELNTFDVKVNALVNRPGGFYLKQSIYCKEKSVAKNLKIMIPKMQLFFKKNNIVSTGKPFVIYNKYDKTNDIIGLSVCIPVRDSLRFSPGSDIEWANMLPFTAVKTTLTGDRSHTQRAWAKTFDYITKQKLVRASSQQVIEVYVKGVDDEKQPSKWVTEIYVPVLPKVVPRKPTYSKPADSTSVAKPATPAEETVTP